MSGFPNQRLPKAQKNEKWIKDTINAIINNSSFSGNVKGKDYARLRDFYNGVVKKTDYNYVINPYNSPEYKDKYPAKIRNYNIIKPVVDLLEGEKTRRPQNLQVVCLNPDAIDRKKEMQYQFILKQFQQEFINQLNQLGFDTGMSSKPTISPMDVQNKFNETYKDARAVLGQDIYDYLQWFLSLDDKYQEAFKNFAIYGTVVTYKEPRFNDVEMEVINPEEFDYDRSRNLRFIEDGAWAVRRTQMTLNQVVDKFHDLLSEDDLKKLEKRRGDNAEFFPGFFLELDSENLNIQTTDNDQLIYVYHTVWKSLKKVGFLTYIDELGQPQEMIVSEDYIFSKEAGDLEIKWEWISEVWHGYRLGKDIFIGGEPFPVQRNSITNPSKCKLPYNGIIETSSIVELGIPYQLLYNIFHFRLELSVAKNKDKILLMEMNTLPKKHGWDEDKFMYTTDAAGFAFVDSTAENSNGEKVTFNQWAVLDMSLSRYISTQFELLSAVKNEWEESLGISRQRKGDIKASDGRGTTDRAIYQSATMTEGLFRRFDTFERKDVASLIDTAMTAYSKGKKASYIIGDDGLRTLEIEEGDLDGIELDVAPVNSTYAYENLQIMRQLSQAFVQNGMEASTLAQLLESTSMSKIKAKLMEVEKAREAYEASMEQAKIKAQQQQKQEELAALREDREDKQMHESVEKQLDREKDIELKKLELEAKYNPGKDINAELARERLNLEREKLLTSERMHNKQLEVTKENNRKKLQLEKEKLHRVKQNS